MQEMNKSSYPSIRRATELAGTASYEMLKIREAVDKANLMLESIKRGTVRAQIAIEGNDGQARDSALREIIGYAQVCEDVIKNMQHSAARADRKLFAIGGLCDAENADEDDDDEDEDEVSAYREEGHL